jgi:hypothetical protein|eukprot:gene6976-5027_t
METRNSDRPDDAWLYLDAKTGEQKGPLPTAVIKRLLEKGLLGLDSKTIVWKSGMDQWKAVAEVPELSAVVEFQSMQWYFMDMNNSQQGPIFSRFLIHKLKEGELDGLTLVYGGKNPEWRKLSEVAELKEALLKLAEEEEALERARENEEHQKKLEEAQLISQQTYIPSDDEIALPVFDKSMMQKDVRSIPTEDSSAPKFFEDDSGNKFKWDEEEQDWVMMEKHEVEELSRMAHHHGADFDAKRKLTGSKRAHSKIGDGKNDDDLDSVASNQSSISDQHRDKAGGETDAVKKKRKSRKKKKVAVTWIYVEGLPGDITFDELKHHFSKVGLIALNPLDQQPRIKIYRDPDTDLCKGDCSICYNAVESVQLAVDVFDGGYIRPNFQISVKRATFDHHQKGAADYAQPGTSSSGGNTFSSDKNVARLKVARSAMRAALSWNEDDDSGMARSSALKIVVLEGMFDPISFKNPSFEKELELDTANECAKFGVIEKLTIFSKHPRGIIIVKFATGFAAQECIRVMNGRFFGGQKIRAFYWDGATNYAVQCVNLEDEEKEEEARLEEFGSWLEQEQAELPEEFRLRTE